jgi:hypothetical protein
MEVTEEPPTAKRTDEAERGTGWIGALVGMPAALGAALLLSGLIGGIVALVVALLGAGSDAGVSSLAGVLATLFLAYPIGRHASGRVASHGEIKHGLLAAPLGMHASRHIAGGSGHRCRVWRLRQLERRGATRRSNGCRRAGIELFARVLRHLRHSHPALPAHRRRHGRRLRRKDGPRASVGEKSERREKHET